MGHGISAYNKGCHCEVCREAYRDKRERLTGRRPKVRQYEGRGVHGQLTPRRCYQNGCREPECVQANRDYSRKYMALWKKGITMKDITDV